MPKEAPDMPTLQQMHKELAASPRISATEYLLKEELSQRHLYGAMAVHIGSRIITTVGRYLVEDGLASSGRLGVSQFLTALFKAIEAQGRGFAHAHGKHNGIPDGMEQQSDILNNHSNCERDLVEASEAYNRKLIETASSLQYESATLPARQLGQDVPPEPFSQKQQKQSKLDGEYELDGITKRQLLEVTPAEPAAHIAQEEQRAAARGGPSAPPAPPASALVSESTLDLQLPGASAQSSIFHLHE